MRRAEGNKPVKPFWQNENAVMEVKLPNSDGKPPVSRLAEMSKATIAVKSPNSGGMTPVSRLTAISRAVKEVKRPNPAGMPPVNRLSDKSREVRVRGRSTGTGPVSRLPDKSREVKADRPVREGTVPLMRLAATVVDRSRPVTQSSEPMVDTVTPIQLPMAVEESQLRNGWAAGKPALAKSPVQ